MNIDEVRSPGNGTASEPSGAESHEKSSKQRTTNGKSGNRRTRGSTVEDRGNAPTKRSNGRPACAGKPNGNGRDRASQPNTAQSAPHQPAVAEKPTPEGQPAAAGKQGSAASVDARGDSDARATVTPAASTDREACAEAALTLNGGKRPGQIEGQSRARGTQPHEAVAEPRVSGDQKELAENPKERLPGGDAPLPDDIADFVDEVHARVDLFEVLSRLLNSEDEKVKQRALERILEMKYGKSSASSEEPVQIILDGPRPQRD